MTDTINSKKLSIGIQNFGAIREGNYYVDKTSFALKLIEQGKYYFLSRTWRFGKSLLIDTLAELFSFNEILFAALYAENNWDWRCKSPVIRFSFGGGNVDSQSQLTSATVKL